LNQRVARFKRQVTSSNGLLQRDEELVFVWADI
jgi:hypothetical protein